MSDDAKLTNVGSLEIIDERSQPCIDDLLQCVEILDQLRAGNECKREDHANIDAELELRFISSLEVSRQVTNDHLRQMKVARTKPGVWKGDLHAVYERHFKVKADGMRTQGRICLKLNV